MSIHVLRNSDYFHYLHTEGLTISQYQGVFRVRWRDFSTEKRDREFSDFDKAKAFALGVLENYDAQLDVSNMHEDDIVCALRFWSELRKK
tara:strand:- start:38038 stop:38307 length:270 start_codon:yes stop_codon:yes gene_type:complete